MGKILKIFGAILVVAILAVIAIPTLFSDKVEKFAKDMANQYINDAEVDFSNFSLSIISSFPNLQAGVDGITVVGKNKFAGDTLLHVGKLRADLDVMSAISGDIVVNSVLLDDVLAQGIVLADSSANWDIVNIASDSNATEEADTAASAPLKLKLDKVQISNARLAYVDSTANISASVDGLNLNLKGDMNGNVYDLVLDLLIDGVSAKLDGISYLKNAGVDFDAKIKADLDSMKFSFDENTLSFAGLPLAFDGWVALKDSSTALDLKLAALQTDFKTIIDLVPDYIMKDVAGLQTTGSFQFYAKANGEFVDMDHIPAVDALLRINDGYVKYPDLPKSLDNINVSLSVANPGGSADLTTVNVDTLHFALGGNPFDVTAHVVKPISNLTFDLGAIGKINLGSLKDALPLDSIEINGVVDANLKVASNLDDINAERYEKVQATGTLGLTDFKFKGSALPDGLDISKALLAFSPKALNLNPLDVKIGKSDISLTGNVEDYLSYVLSDGTIKGNATLRSSLLDCNELLAMTASDNSAVAEADSSAQTVSSSESTPLELPTNIDFKFNTDIKKLVYDRLELSDISGNVTLKDGVANLSNLKMTACDGTMALNGKFQTPKGKNSKVDMNIDLSNIDVNKLTGSFSIIDSLLPIAHSAYGRVNVGLDIVAELDQELSPVLSSINGNGSFGSSAIELKGSEFQQKLSTLLSNDKYNDINIKDCRIKYTIENGSVVVNPFNLNIFNKVATFSGKQGLDQSMDYLLSLPIARQDVLDLVGKMGVSLGSSAAEGSDLPIGVAIKGVLTKPELKLDLSEATQAIKDEATAKAKEAVSDAASKAIDQLSEKVSDNEKVQDAVNSIKSGLGGLLNKKSKSK